MFLGHLRQSYERFWLCFPIQGRERRRKEFCCAFWARRNYEVDSTVFMNVHWVFFQPFFFFQVLFLFLRSSDWSVMFFQYVKLSHLRLSIEGLFLSQIGFKHKAFFSKVTDEKMQLPSFLVWLSRDDTELMVSISTVDFIYVSFLYRLYHRF